MRYAVGWLFLTLLCFSGGFVLVVPFWVFEHGGWSWAAIAVLAGAGLNWAALYLIGRLFAFYEERTVERVAAAFDDMAEQCINEQEFVAAIHARANARFIRKLK